VAWFEIWVPGREPDRQKTVSVLDKFPGRGMQMAEYRAYIMDQDGHVSRAIELICPDDETAKEYAEQLADGHDVELWQGDHQIATFDRKPE
jgi:hypothetical protein